MKTVIISVVSVIFLAGALLFGYAFMNKEEIETVKSTAGGAVENLQKFQARARQSEAKVSLLGAYTQFKIGFAENGKYAADTVENYIREHLSDPEMGPLNYTLATAHESCPDCKVEDNSFKIIAFGNIDEDETIDIWTIDDTKKLVNVVDDTQL